MRVELESPENLLLSSNKISLCRTSGWCWQNVLLAREAPNWSLSASRIPSSLLLTHRLAGYLQFLLSHHSIKLAEKGPPLLVLTKLGIEPVTLVSNIENSIKPGQTIVGIYLIHPELPLWSLGEFFPKNPNSILSYMSSRRTGIEDLKSDLICRLFAAPDMEEGGGGLGEHKFANVAKSYKFVQRQMSKCIFETRAQVVWFAVCWWAGGGVVMKGELAMLISIMMMMIIYTYNDRALVCHIFVHFAFPLCQAPVKLWLAP